MAETAEIGYNTVIKSGNSTFAGVTSDDFTMSPETKESITKADSGAKRIAITRVPCTLKVNGICSVDSSNNVLDREDIIDLVNAKATFIVSYCVGTTTYSGTGYASGYNESTPASPDEDCTYGLDITCPNGLTKTV